MTENVTREDRRAHRPYIATTAGLREAVRALPVIREFLNRLYGYRNYRILGFKVKQGYVRTYYTVRRCLRVRITNIQQKDV